MLVVSAAVPRTTIARLRKVAKRRQWSISQVVRDVIRDWDSRQRAEQRGD